MLESISRVGGSIKDTVKNPTVRNVGLAGATALGFFYGAPVAAFLASNATTAYLTYQLGSGFWATTFVIGPAASNAAAIASGYGAGFGTVAFPMAYSALSNTTYSIFNTGRNWFTNRDHNERAQSVVEITALSFGEEIANAVKEAIEAKVIGKKLTKQLFDNYVGRAHDRMDSLSELNRNSSALDIIDSVKQYEEQSFESQKEFFQEFSQKLAEYAGTKGKQDLVQYENVMNAFANITAIANLSELEEFISKANLSALNTHVNKFYNEIMDEQVNTINSEIDKELSKLEEAMADLEEAVNALDKDSSDKGEEVEVKADIKYSEGVFSKLTSWLWSSKVAEQHDTGITV